MKTVWWEAIQHKRDYRKLEVTGVYLTETGKIDLKGELLLCSTNTQEGEREKSQIKYTYILHFRQGN